MGVLTTCTSKMTELTTTLRKISPEDTYLDDQGALYDYLGKTRPDDEPLPLRTIAAVLGLHAALKCLSTVDGYRNAMRLYACNCARRVLPDYEYECPDDPHIRNAIVVSERHARGQAADRELRAAAKSVAWAATEATVGYAAFAAALVAVGAVNTDAAWGAFGAAANANPHKATRNRRDHDAARDWLTQEFCRLCRLEGEYGEVAP